MAKRVLILGATSAVAAEVAKIHAARCDRLHLVGRNATKLEAVASECSEAQRVAGTSNAAYGSGAVTCAIADFSALESAEGIIATSRAALSGIDTVLIAHGDLGDQAESERSFAAAESILRTNFTSVVALLIPLANEMETAGAGTIGVITSVAGERGRPRNYTYGAAKGALNVFLQGLRTRLYPRGVKVTTLKLGPVDSPMTKDHKKHVLFGKPRSSRRTSFMRWTSESPKPTSRRSGARSCRS